MIAFADSGTVNGGLRFLADPISVWTQPGWIATKMRSWTSLEKHLVSMFKAALEHLEIFIINRYTLTWDWNEQLVCKIFFNSPIRCAGEGTWAEFDASQEGADVNDISADDVTAFDQRQERSCHRHDATHVCVHDLEQFSFKRLTVKTTTVTKTLIYSCLADTKLDVHAVYDKYCLNLERNASNNYKHVPIQIDSLR